MTEVKPPYRRAPIDHVAEVLIHMEQSEAALARVDQGKLSRAQLVELRALKKAILASKLACADAIEAFLEGQLKRPAKAPARRAPAPRKAAS